VSGCKSGFPEATTPELDDIYFHFNGGSPSHMACAGQCEYGGSQQTAVEAASLIGPREATGDDVVDAVIAAGKAAGERGDYRSAWEQADAASDSHLRAVHRTAERDREAGS